MKMEFLPLLLSLFKMYVSIVIFTDIQIYSNSLSFALLVALPDHIH